MPIWWKREEEPKATKRAVAYYRHSAEDKWENSVPIQREQVTRFAKEHGIKIIKEFADKGKSGLTTQGRDAFMRMLRDYVEVETMCDPIAGVARIEQHLVPEFEPAWHEMPPPDPQVP